MSHPFQIVTTKNMYMIQIKVREKKLHYLMIPSLFEVRKPEWKVHNVLLTY